MSASRGGTRVVSLAWTLAGLAFLGVVLYAASSVNALLRVAAVLLGAWLFVAVVLLVAVLVALLVGRRRRDALNARIAAYADRRASSPSSGGVGG